MDLECKRPMYGVRSVVKATREGSKISRHITPRCNLELSGTQVLFGTKLHIVTLGVSQWY